MGAVCCPPALEPPTPQHAKCKKILMILALVLVPIAIFSLLVGDSSQFFIFLFLIFFLFMGWRTFNWCTILIFFLYSLQQIVQSTIIIVGLIQYDKFFRTKYVPASAYILVEEIYFIFAILISHYVYRVFKSYSSGQGHIFNNNAPAEAPQGQYQPLREQNRANNQHVPFQGQGVRIN